MKTDKEITMDFIFFTSDLHLGHSRVLDFCPSTRRGSCGEEMTDMIIENIRSTIPTGGVLYNLGDFSFSSLEKTESYLTRIFNAGIEHHIILGNHDKTIVKNPQLHKYFESVSHKKIISVGLQQIVMSHCPFASGQWDSAHYGSWHLHGHTHGKFLQEGKCMDVGIDTRPTGDMKPWSYKEIESIMKFQEVIKSH